MLRLPRCVFCVALHRDNIRHFLSTVQLFSLFVRVFPAALSHETIIQNELLLPPPGYDEDAARELRVDIIIALTHSHDDVASRLESKKSCHSI